MSLGFDSHHRSKNYLIMVTKLPASTHLRTIDELQETIIIMAQKTTIKKDHLGLYVIAGGYITRPFYGTKFKEGDEVKSHHFGGSTDAGVTYNEKEFNFRNGKYEFWTTTGITQIELKEERKIRPNGYHDFDKGKSWEQIYQESYDFYKSHSKMLSFFREKHNRDFWNNLQSNQN
jgi:hypothetical protein